MRTMLFDYAAMVALVVCLGVLVVTIVLKLKPRTLLVGVLVILGLFLLLEPKGRIPVVGATPRDWHPESFWFEPWGASIVHRGIDIFASQGVGVVAASDCLVLYSGMINVGGNVVLCLDIGLRLHYYAHLHSIEARGGAWIPRSHPVGRVGSTGNALGKPAHLHYSVMSVIPRPWRATDETLGWMRALYINPVEIWTDHSTETGEAI